MGFEFSAALLLPQMASSSPFLHLKPYHLFVSLLLQGAPIRISPIRLTPRQVRAWNFSLGVSGFGLSFRSSAVEVTLCIFSFGSSIAFQFGVLGNRFREVGLVWLISVFISKVSIFTCGSSLIAYRGLSSAEMAGGNHKKFPAFFELYDADLMERMPIPDSFLRCLKGVVPKKTILRNNLGQCWGVEVKRTGQKTIFEEGWKQFCKAHSVQTGDFLVFQYNGEVYDCRVLGHSMCEKAIPPSREEMEELLVVKEEDIDMEEQEHKDDDDHDGEAGEQVDDEDDDYHDGCEKTVPPSREEEDIGMEEEEHKDVEDDDDGDYHVGDEDGAAHMPPIYPSFEARLRTGTPRKTLRVPLDLLRDNNIELADTIFFQDPLGRKWCGKVSIWADGATWIGGWKHFCKMNSVEQGDTCICEFMLDNEGHLCTGYDCIHRCDTIKVQIIRQVY